MLDNIEQAKICSRRAKDTSSVESDSTELTGTHVIVSAVE